jgi:hypothetical protein
VSFRYNEERNNISDKKKTTFDYSVHRRKMSSDSRKKNYKNTGLDSEELRKRREDLNITLRKQKREEQV